MCILARLFENEIFKNWVENFNMILFSNYLRSFGGGKANIIMFIAILFGNEKQQHEHPRYEVWEWKILKTNHRAT